MYIAKRSTLNKLADSFGFEVDVVGSKAYLANGELRTIYTTKRPNGNKFYHAVMFPNGIVIAV